MSKLAIGRAVRFFLTKHLIFAVSLPIMYLQKYSRCSNEKRIYGVKYPKIIRYFGPAILDFEICKKCRWKNSYLNIYISAASPSLTQPIAGACFNFRHPRDFCAAFSSFTLPIAFWKNTLTTMVYIRIYLAARRHKNQIQALHVQQNGEMTNFASTLKSAVGIFYVYLLFVVCYLPYLISMEIHGPSIPLKRLYFFSLTLVLLNSSLNPVIYCWKMRHIRHAVMDILRNIPWYRNRASH